MSHFQSFAIIVLQLIILFICHFAHIGEGFEEKLLEEKLLG